MRTWLEVVQRGCQVRGLSNDDAMVRGRWRKMIRMVDEQEGVSGRMFLLVPANPGRPAQNAVKWSCVCVLFIINTVACYNNNNNNDNNNKN